MTPGKEGKKRRFENQGKKNLISFYEPAQKQGVSGIYEIHIFQRRLELFGKAEVPSIPLPLG